jgi:hypothetical protein
MVNDDNPNNVNAACGTLFGALINHQINANERRDKLTAD